jgi:hypothetical protein
LPDEDDPDEDEPDEDEADDDSDFALSAAVALARESVR